MISLYIQCILVVIYFTTFGYPFKNHSKNISVYASQLIYGSILMSFMALIINFFLPLNKYINTIFLLISLFILIKFRKTYYTKSFFFYLFSSSFLIFLLIAESDVYRPDAGLYHLPYINILNNEKIIFGLANLHFRYGHISIMQYLSAISNNLLFGINGIVFAQALIASAVITNFLYFLHRYNKKKIYNIHFFYLFSILLFVFFKMIRYSEYGNDAPSHFILFFLVSEILREKNFNPDKLCNFLILSGFIILNKITLLFAAFIPLYILLINKKNFFVIFKLVKFYFLLIFIFFWFLKNFIVSGCVVFPVKSTCFKFVEWNSLKIAKKISQENEAWTKGWPDYELKVTKNNETLMNIEDYSKNFKWVKYWYEGHFKEKIVKILIPYFSILVLFFYIFKEKKSKNFRNNFKNNSIIYLIIILTIATAFWLIKIPVFRYGYSYFISLFSVLFGYLCCKNNVKINSIYKNINIFLFLCLLVFTGKNTIRIHNSANDYENYPWPKYFNMNKNNSSPEIKEFLINDLILYKPINDGFCMYYKSPCGHYGERDLSKIYNKFSYTFIIAK